MLINLSIVLLGYLSGSICSAIITCRMMGLGDPRGEGSGNPGATNVLRLYGKPAAISTLTGDVIKGIIPVLAARYLQLPELYIALTGVAAFAGHLYPVFFRFRGGKGVATLIGVLIATDWLLGIAFVGTWLLAALLFRYASLAAIIASILTPVYAWLWLGSLSYLVCFSGMSAALIWRHRSNIANLFAGTEDRIGARNSSP